MDEKHGSGPTVETIPEGDNRARLMCPDCGYIAYDNPKIIVGAVCVWEGRILLCRRGIPPARGRWTIPAGFMERGETLAAGAAREVWEEATARVVIGPMIGIYEIAHISQVNIVFLGTMANADHAVGAESLDVRLFAWEEIPWDDLAFPSVAWALRRFREGGGPHLGAAPPRAKPARSV